MPLVFKFIHPLYTKMSVVILLTYFWVRLGSSMWPLHFVQWDVKKMYSVHTETTKTARLDILKLFFKHIDINKWTVTTVHLGRSIGSREFWQSFSICGFCSIFVGATKIPFMIPFPFHRYIIAIQALLTKLTLTQIPQVALPQTPPQMCSICNNKCNDNSSS